MLHFWNHAREPVLYTLQQDFVLDIVGCQAENQYSKCGLTSDLYSRSNTYGALNDIDRWIKPSALLALVTVGLLTLFGWLQIA